MVMRMSMVMCMFMVMCMSMAAGFFITVVVMFVIMVVAMFMIVAMVVHMITLMVVTMAAVMLVAVDMSGNGLRLHIRSVGMPAFGRMAAKQIFHVMVMIFMSGVQSHVKITHIQTGLLHPAYGNGKSVHRQRAKRPLQSLSSGSQIQKRRRRHIAADASHTFQI